MSTKNKVYTTYNDKRDKRGNKENASQKKSCETPHFYKKQTSHFYAIKLPGQKLKMEMKPLT